MARPEKLNSSEISAALTTLDGWTYMEGKNAIFKKFVFKDFVDAFAFMTKIAIHAEKMDHHPNWFNVYKTVEVTLTTHDVSGVTELDIKLAEIMNKMAQT